MYRLESAQVILPVHGWNVTSLDKTDTGREILENAVEFV